MEIPVTLCEVLPVAIVRVGTSPTCSPRYRGPGEPSARETGAHP
jgi:hypothetical protein